MRKLIIVESPTKARTIQKIVGGEYQVVASRGHVVDLPSTGSDIDGLGVDIKNNFKPEYVVTKKPTVDYLKGIADVSSEILLATDPDREGEAIAWHLAQVLKLDLHTTKRLEFHEITKRAILSALENDKLVNIDLVNAYEARRVIDRILGYKLSSLIQKATNGQSAGRVQSVVLQMFVTRKNEIDSFIPERYYDVKIKYGKYEFSLEKINGTTVKMVQDEVQDLLSNYNQVFKVVGTSETVKEHYPQPALTTSTMFITAKNTLRFSPETTRQLAQKLYENGYITYIRTDSTALSPLFISAGRKVLEKIDVNLVSGHVRLGKTQKGAQEAHEAIRPANVDVPLNEIKDKIKADKLDDDAYALYELIYYRSLAALAKPRLANEIKTVVTSDFQLKEANITFLTKYDVDTSPTTLEFTQLLSHTIDPGYTKLSKKFFNYSDSDKFEQLIAGQTYSPAPMEYVEKVTKPKPLYNDGTIIKEMEDTGIGRPSTYSTTIQTLKKRKYIIAQKNDLVPTEEGIKVSSYLGKYFLNFIDIPYTAQLEEELDEITEAKIDKLTVLNDFYTLLEKLLIEANREMEINPPKKEDRIAPKVLDEFCPKCGKPLVERTSHNNKFIGCQGYPTCTYTKPIIPDNAIKCNLCKTGFMIIRKGKYGTFLACSNPDCKNTKHLTKKK
jgi:DNA topoisomerase-1